MNREIKFRAWIKDVMVDVRHVDFQDKWIGHENLRGDNLTDTEPVSETDPHYLTDFKDCVLMQFTGLLDKNGKEIYEGDIVRMKEEYAGRGRPIEKTMQGQVVWDKEVAGFLLMNGGWQSGLGYPQGAINGSEIIGNIYETPDLMKE